MVKNVPLHIFQGYGVEIECMIVRQDSLDILPITDKLLEAASGKRQNEISMGDIAWSNELTLHVVELKTNGPVNTLAGVAHHFQDNIHRVNELLADFNACLMPTAMHPWMDPHSETVLWPHGNRTIYETYNRIFDCQGHGWANVQSTHLNLAFHDDEEFARLHAAIRLVLPILPALAASSPLVDGAPSGLLDSRLKYYRTNQRRVPSIAGAIIPEQVYSRKDYEEVILARNYKDIAPYDPKGILQEEWLNSRGAIARFERSAIEIRVLDCQECPAADLAVLTAIDAVLKALVAEDWQPFQTQSAIAVEPLAALFGATIEHGEETVITDSAYLACFGLSDKEIRVTDLWRYLLTNCLAENDPAWKHLDIILAHGPLSRRIKTACGENPDRAIIHQVYKKLCTCLAQGEMFVP